MSDFVSVSGGLDSTALSILLHEGNKWQYIFADTGDEFPQVYEHLNKMESILNIEIIRVQNADYTLGEYEIKNKYFPNPRSRFCTRMFKIKPIQDYCDEYAPYQMAIGIRADEDRIGGLGKNIVYPLKELNINKCDVVTLCQHYDLIPNYPWYMSRGGCYSCFFKSKQELLALAKYEPELFDKLIEREKLVNDGFERRKKYYSMFQAFYLMDKYKTYSLEDIKRIADSQEQIEMFKNDKLLTDEHEDCGIYCRK